MNHTTPHRTTTRVPPTTPTHSVVVYIGVRTHARMGVVAWAQVFNVGDKRRTKRGYMSQDSYNFNDKEYMDLRFQMSVDTMGDMKQFLVEKPSRIAIFDASNVTRKRRKWIHNELTKLGELQVIFVELINSKTMIHRDEMADTDQEHTAGQDAVGDYQKRVKHYQRNYEPIASDGPEDVEHTYSYIKCVENGSKIIMNKIDG